MKTLRDLLPETIALPEGADSIRVTSLTADSRQVAPGSLFVAVRGTREDGSRFVEAARAAGALAVLGETEPPAGFPGVYIRVPDARLALAECAAAFHGHPSRAMRMIGVTGTSGKTTTTYLLESILIAAGMKVGVIGTVNFRYGGKVLDSTHTTPGPVELQALLAEMRAGGCDAVVMEVSSHALKQHRVAGIAFDGMIFSNLSPEHLDFHPDMEDYFRSKSMLFHEVAEASLRAGKRPVAAVNADDPYGARLLADIENRIREGGRAALRSAPRPDYRAQGFGLDHGREGAGLSVGLGGIRGRAGNVEVDSALTGRFNAYNILAAVTLTRAMGVDTLAIERGVRELPVVPGRLERVPMPPGTPVDQAIHVLVDYAHKPDALEKVLRTLRDVRDGHRLIAVFGCGGDRDRTKRPVMGRIAQSLADHVWVTSDNPRTEKPDAIIAEILAGMEVPPRAPSACPFTVEADRRAAIHGAIAMAQAGDLVVIAGKGHEDYQIIADAESPGGTRKIRFDDREVAAEALRAVPATS